MKYFLTISLFLSLSSRTMAQNESLLPLFDQAKSYFCSALTGDKGKTTFYAIGGYQYFSNASYILTHDYRSSINLDYSSPVYTKGPHRLSLGVFCSNQINNIISSNTKYNYQRNNARVNFAYSYKSHAGTFSIGSYADLTNININYNSLQNYFRQSGSIPNTGLGIAYRSKNEIFYIGGSVNNIFTQNLYTKDLSSRYIYYKTSVDYYLNSGIAIPINANLTISPSVNIRYNTEFYYSNNMTYNTNLMAEYKNKYLFGVVYNLIGNNDLGGLRFGYKTKNIAIHYAFLTYLSRLSQVESGQHTLGVVFTPKHQ